MDCKEKSFVQTTPWRRQRPWQLHERTHKIYRWPLRWSRWPTCSRVVGPGIIYSINIGMIHHRIVPHPILLISLGIKNCYVQVPHCTHGIQHNFIPPELLIQQMPTVRFVGQGTLESRSLLLLAIAGLQCCMFVVPDSLVVLDQPHNDLPAKVLGWIEGSSWASLCLTPKPFLMAVKGQFPLPSTYK